MAQNIFEPLVGPPPAVIVGSRPDHPVTPPNIADSHRQPIPTNKFYANFLLGSQNQGTWTHPYSVCWAKGSGNAQSWGLSISHIDEDQRAYGPDADADPIQYYINPIGIQSLIISASEISSSAIMSLDSLTSFSVNVNIHPHSGVSPAITFPLVQGMGFVTGVYTNSSPLIQSSVFFRSVTPISVSSSRSKYKILLEDGKTWLLYATPTSTAGSSPLELRQTSNTSLASTKPFSGCVQLAKNRFDDVRVESLYDGCAGAYATSLFVAGSVTGSEGTYSFQYKKLGSSSSGRLLMFALPHHVQSFDRQTTASLRPFLRMQTTTKGAAMAVAADTWTMVERELPIDMAFSPWARGSSESPLTLSKDVLAHIQRAAISEIEQDFRAQCCLDSMYFSGKGLTKFAMLVWTIHAVLKDPILTTKGLNKLKEVLEVFTSNSQQFPLVYEATWKSVVSSGSYVTDNALQDFGNTYYNDHHFHYGYFIYTAAVVGHLDPSWLEFHKDWINLLVRDAANPSQNEPDFPFSRGFDWFHGHSWAKGLFESADGKDEESSSEDAFFAYALKMWGRTVGDPSMESRGNLMLGVLRRSLQNYLLLEDDNRNHPPRFVGNKVTGILFENKVDHTTYFGHVTEYIQGIHMIPINPSTSYVRSRAFVEEEWRRYFDGGRVDEVAGGWRGLVYANLAGIDPLAAWNFFSQENFQSEWLDGGASLTWYLVYAAVLLKYSQTQ